MGEWIEHDGKGCPVPAGTLVEIKRRDGVTYGPFPAMSRSVNSAGHVLKCLVGWFSAWNWNDGSPNACIKIIAYRIHDDSQSESRRAERMAEFRRIADEGVKNDKPVRAPQKERV